MNIADKTKDTCKKFKDSFFKIETGAPLFIFIVFLLAFVYFFWREKYESSVILLLIIIMYILPITPFLYYWQKTRHIRKLNPLNIENSDVYKIFEMKEDSKNLVMRALYISGLERNFMLYIANFYLIFFTLSFFILFLKIIIPPFTEISLGYCVAFLILFLILYLLSISSILKKEIEKSPICTILKDSLYYILNIIFLMFGFIIIFGTLIISITQNVGWLEMLFKPNAFLLEKHLTLASIIFTFFAIFMSSIVIGGYKSSLEVKNRLERKLRVYRRELREKYERFLDNNSWTELMVNYLNDEIEIEREKDVFDICNMLPYRKFKIPVLRYFSVGFLFIIYRIPQLFSSNKATISESSTGITLDLLLFLMFLAFIVCDTYKIYSHFKINIK